MSMKLKSLLPLVAAVAGVFAVPQVRAEAFEDCLHRKLSTAGDDVTLGELRAECDDNGSTSAAASTPAPETGQGQQLSPLQQRFETEFDNMDRSFAITTHQPNYIMTTHNSKTNQAPAQAIVGEDAFDDDEVKFQVSMKLPLARDMFEPGNDLYFAFTSTSWWQLYNDDNSSPFRETNYEPEIFWRHYGGPEFLGGEIAGFDVGLNHESNGRGADFLSRSWNRVMVRSALDYGNLLLLGRAWYRIPEDDEDDDNPHMHRYYGYGDLTAVWAPNRNTFTAMLRPGTEENAVELTWSYPITKTLRIYTQYFNGYGESLLDYNVRTERVGIGIAINDIVQRP
jgi:phospholipase A1